MWFTDLRLTLVLIALCCFWTHAGSLRDYLLQPTNTVLKITFRLGEQTTKLAFEKVKNRTENDLTEFVCIKILETLNEEFEIPVFDNSSCLLDKIDYGSTGVGVQVLIGIPQSMLLDYNYYNNRDDFVYLIGYVMTMESLKDLVQHAVGVELIQIGSSTTQMLLRGTVICGTPQYPCKGNKPNFNFTKEQQFMEEACMQTLVEIKRGDPVLAGALSGCWTFFVDIEDPDDLVQYTYFDWNKLFNDGIFINRTQFVSRFDDARHKGPLERVHEIFNVTTTELDYAGDGIPVYFQGKLLNNGSRPTWTDHYRLSTTVEYISVFNGIKKQLLTQIHYGNKNLFNTIRRFNLVKISNTHPDITVDGYFMVSQLMTRNLNISQLRLQDSFSHAHQTGRQYYPDRFITDVTFARSSRSEILSPLVILFALVSIVTVM